MDSMIEDRAAGVVLGLACGDALGAGYEFGPPLADDAPVMMRGGGLGDFEPGEWTDDTAMAVPLLEVATAGGRFDRADLDRIAARWLEWSRTAKDIGNQTRKVLAAARSVGTADALLSVSRELERTTGRGAGNGSRGTQSAAPTTRRTR